MRLARKQERQVEHVDSEGSWAISYGDMITLLLSFFVLYFTVDHDRVRSNQMQQALIVKLNEGDITAQGAEGMGTDRRLDIGYNEGTDIDEAVIKKLGAKVHVVGERLLIEFPHTSFFELGVVDVNSSGEKALHDFAKLYQPFAGQYELVIGAYTDTRTVRSNASRFKDNLELSALRSVAAVRVLQKSGIPLRYMKVAGFGELTEQTQAIMKNETGEDPLRFSRKVVLAVEPMRKE